ncbi:MAG: molybdopterin-dependent oxidoreductase [Anaerolineaceae bacterium]|nr:molybdopterin-dependent oxidoreductase [Anaerolineaceae bacterium]
MDKIRKPTIWTGVLVGVCLTAPLIAVFYLVQQLVGTVFVPFDVFDWVGRVAPGGLVRFGIETIVQIITTLKIGNLDSAAKTAEQTMAISGMFVTCVVVSAVLYGLLPRFKTSQVPLAGLVAGLIIGVPVMLISAAVDINSTQSELVNAIWILLGFMVWGLALGWVYNRLTVSSVTTASESAMVESIDRRNFLIRLGGATAAITLVGAGLGAALRRTTAPSNEVALNTDTSGAALQPWSATHKLPNDGDPVIPAAGTRPELTPVGQHYRIDINTIPPRIAESEWKLSVGGLVDEPFEMTLAELKSKYQPVDEFVTLACISNPLAGELTSTTRWTGVKLKDFVADMHLKSNATHLKITSADNFDEFVDIETINKDERVMLAYEWDGLPLAVDHGFPLRVYIPNHYGMKQPKWITTIEAVDSWHEGWWVRRGWDKDAIMEATSVIDTVAVNDTVTKDDKKLIPIGGIAHAGSRGISKVELKVDDADWVEAELRKPISDVTWVIWRYDWPFSEGSHTFTVRCTDGEGTLQKEANRTPGPGGATGWHHIGQTV